MRSVVHKFANTHIRLNAVAVPDQNIFLKWLFPRHYFSHSDSFLQSPDVIEIESRDFSNSLYTTPGVWIYTKQKC
jgi:hypothetical protein